MTANFLGTKKQIGTDPISGLGMGISTGQAHVRNPHRSDFQNGNGDGRPRDSVVHHLPRRSEDRSGDRSEDRSEDRSGDSFLRTDLGTDLGEKMVQIQFPDMRTDLRTDLRTVS